MSRAVRMVRVLGLGAGLVLAAGVEGCDSSSSRTVSRCRSSDECPASETCVSGRCLATTDDDGGADASTGGGAGTGGSSATGGSSGDAASGGASTGGAPADAGSGAITDASADAPADASTDAAPLVCATGTASCDANPSDCETDLLTDALNCGRCARACGGTAKCLGGRCEATVVMDPDVVSNYCGWAFTTDKAFFITCWGTQLSEVRSVSLSVGADVRGTQIAAYQGIPVVALRGLLVDGDSVFFGIEGKPSSVFKYPVSGSGVVTTAFTTGNDVRFDALQLVNDTYYFIDNSHAAGGQVAPSNIMSRPKAGNTDTTLVSGTGTSSGLLVTPTSLFWVETRTQGASPSVYRAPIAGTGGDASLVTEVAPTGSGTYTTLSGAYVYWSDKVAAPNGKIRRLAHGAASAQPEDVAVNLNLPEGLATDGSYLYFKQLDVLYRVPMDGSVAPEALSVTVPANDAQATHIFHVDDNYVYFAAGPTGGDSKVMRVAK